MAVIVLLSPGEKRNKPVLLTAGENARDARLNKS
jgi:hypothetical protein